jgi:N utilization substance protein B
MPSRRRKIRERVLQALYAFELSREPLPFVLETVLADLKKDEENYRFAAQLIEKVVETSPTLDELIRDRVTNWEFGRLAVIDRLILRMAICELLYFEDIPPKVSINEAIEIARRFSTEKSDKFVNGVLDSVFDTLRSSGRLKKSGRGLLETSLRHKEPE